MAEYIVTSPRFTGFLKFVFDEEQTLQRFENNAVLTDKQMLFLKNHFPFTVSDLPSVLGEKGKLEEINDVSFDTFWQKYGYKKGKVNAQKQWAKLDEASKTKAIAMIPRYIYDCKTHNRDMVYAERYLKDRRFDDE